MFSRRKSHFVHLKELRFERAMFFFFIANVHETLNTVNKYDFSRCTVYIPCDRDRTHASRLSFLTHTYMCENFHFFSSVKIIYSVKFDTI